MHRVERTMATGSKQSFRTLSADEIQQLTEQGCTADDWGCVQVTDPFQAERMRGVEFAGKVSLGSLAGNIERAEEQAKPCGVYHARLQDCVVGNGVRIANVGSHLASYHIGDNVLIENIGVMEAHTGAQFGNGVEVVALNEAGGREVPLFNGLSSQ